ncbi:hypothetical protein [Listeria cornellensis]|uniref:CRISPR-associated protein cas5, tneap subtype n=1 Tax=Listeria cornellensis FSL F6-0969 TaxID=1265820 RepID=W7CA72_9LIST|nr:hypothetical protein [Listeria cornellensis]EUJ32651.1 CRISPR-associated protein cas5, tneap subtype [Listeria cornellensis FSL F6-0969]
MVAFERNIKFDKNISVDTGYGAYIPSKDVENKAVIFGQDVNIGRRNNLGTRYLLTSTYELVNRGTAKAPKMFRNWLKKDVFYATDVTVSASRSYSKDEDDKLMFVRVEE